MASVEEIKSAIVDRETELRKKFHEDNIIERQVRRRAEGMLSKDAALIITGPRRCGKSILAFMLGSGRKFAYANFEDERMSMDGSELNKVLEAIYSLKGEVRMLIFDEIQNIPGWEKFISRLIGTKEVVLTGSNARLLSKELSTYLTGRHVDMLLLPFSFQEFLALKGLKYNMYRTSDRAKIKNSLNEYLEIGGFPTAQKLGRFFLAENYKDIIERDVIQRYRIRNPAVFKELAKYLISNASNEVSFNRLKNIFGIKSPHTVKQYATYLCDAYLIFMLERFSFKLKQQVLAPKKVYCIDNGILSTIGFKVSSDRGKMIENLVAVELFRRSNEKRLQLYYWKDHQQREVDFVIKDAKEVILLVQATDVSSRQELENREIYSLLRASSELRCSNLVVITYDYEGEEKFGSKKVRFVPLWKWLLQDFSNP